MISASYFQVFIHSFQLSNTCSTASGYFSCVVKLIDDVDKRYLENKARRLKIIYQSHDYSEASTSEKHPCVLCTGMLNGAVYDQDRLVYSINVTTILSLTLNLAS